MASQNQVVALRMFSRKNGATVEQVGKALDLEEKQVRGLVDRIRADEKANIRNEGFGSRRFRVVSKGRRGN